MPRKKKEPEFEVREPNRHEKRQIVRSERLKAKHEERGYRNIPTQKQLMIAFYQHKPSLRKTPEQESIFRKMKNIEKHLRIGKATKGGERRTHLDLAVFYIKKYGFNK